MIICFIRIKNNLFCVDNVRRIYILINWLGLRGLKSDSLIWFLDVFAIAFRIYQKGPLIMYDYHSGNLPSIFDPFFIKVNPKHNYNTRLASKSSFSLPKIRTNYGKFNIKFTGAKVWNSIGKETKKLSKFMFKKKLKNYLLESYKQIDSA